jgi:hypothetical protein
MEEGFLHKLIVAQWAKKFHTFYEMENLVPCLQDPINGSYIKPERFDPQTLIPFLKAPF